MLARLFMVLWCLVRRCGRGVLCTGEKAAVSGRSVVVEDGSGGLAAELESVRTKYEQAARERDDVERAYTHARHEVDILLHSLHQMKAERDQAIDHQQRAPASSSVVSSPRVTPR